jgi:hypothetical protein
MYLKLKTIVLAVILSSFCPLEANDLTDFNLANGQIKYIKKFQIKDKRSITKTRTNFSNNKKITNDAELIAEYRQIFGYDKDFSYSFIILTGCSSPLTKYAVWSKSTFF